MRTHPKTKTARFKRALTLFIVALAAWFVCNTINLFGNIWTASPRNVELTVSLILLLAVAAITVGIAILLAINHLLRTRAVVGTPQRFALRTIQLFAILSLLPLPLDAAVHIWSVKHSSFSSPTGAQMPSILQMPLENWWGLLRTSLNLLGLVPWLIVLLPPSIQLSSWKGKREWSLRILVGLLLLWSLIFLAPYLAWYAFQNDTGLRWLSKQLGPMRFWDLCQALQLLFVSSLAVLLFHLRKHVHQLLPSPNHCSSCAYPLDPSMHTCPECGTTREPGLTKA